MGVSTALGEFEARLGCIVRLSPEGRRWGEGRGSGNSRESRRMTGRGRWRQMTEKETEICKRELHL